MDNYSSYQGGGTGAPGDSHFQRLSQTIGSNIQKISQNGIVTILSLTFF